MTQSVPPWNEILATPLILEMFSCERNVLTTLCWDPLSWIKGVPCYRVLELFFFASFVYGLDWMDMIAQSSSLAGHKQSIDRPYHPKISGQFAYSFRPNFRLCDVGMQATSFRWHFKVLFFYFFRKKRFIYQYSLKRTRYIDRMTDTFVIKKP